MSPSLANSCLCVIEFFYQYNVETWITFSSLSYLLVILDQRCRGCAGTGIWFRETISCLISVVTCLRCLTQETFLFAERVYMRMKNSICIKGSLLLCLSLRYVLVFFFILLNLSVVWLENRDDICYIYMLVANCVIVTLKA